MGQSVLEWERELKTPVAGSDNLGCSHSSEKILSEVRMHRNLFDYVAKSPSAQNTALFSDDFTEKDFRTVVIQWKRKNGLVPSA